MATTGWQEEVATGVIPANCYCHSKVIPHRAAIKRRKRMEIYKRPLTDRAHCGPESVILPTCFVTDIMLNQT